MSTLITCAIVMWLGGHTVEAKERKREREKDRERDFWQTTARLELAEHVSQPVRGDRISRPARREVEEAGTRSRTRSWMIWRRTGTCLRPIGCRVRLRPIVDGGGWREGLQSV
ncbi:unnamed protein product [Protopolystoma xenopodis]|uniref:Secreted protein n=1 Tax=Protopolystoma xenopodis TaxID=117903 RepID=A0A448X3S7_9PLAT|nr:unnamed protein product [Protopolystoma xenopodis]